MPVNLKLIPALATKPRSPKWWVWLLLLLFGIALGTIDLLLDSRAEEEVTGEIFWAMALGLPILIWLTSLLLRIAWYRGQQVTAAGRDHARELQIQHETERGRRSLQVLAVSLHSALRAPNDTTGQNQENALQSNTQALKTQMSWQGSEGLRHSRLALVDSESPEQLLLRVMTKALEELSTVLALVSADLPLRVQIESSSYLSASQVEAIWLESLKSGHIRQRITLIEGSGLAAVDRWLDHHFHEESLLLVMALQVAPEDPQGTAEAVVSLLLGNAQVATRLVPQAVLHRPEQTENTSPQDLHYALQQSLNWVPAPIDAVKRGWLVGVGTAWHEAIASTLQSLSSPIKIGQDLDDLNSMLGYPGIASPWVAIACATFACQRSGDPQLILSGSDQVAMPLWVTVVMPVTKT